MTYLTRLTHATSCHRVAFVRFILLIIIGFMLSGCGTPYGHTGSMGGVKVFELSPEKIEIMVLGTHYISYGILADTWKRKADEEARLRGAEEYEIISFSAGREFLGMEIIGEGSFLERYADDTVFWLPKIARGVIRIDSPTLPKRRAGRPVAEPSSAENKRK